MKSHAEEHNFENHKAYSLLTVHLQERGEIATCGMGNKVKIWDVRKPSSIRLKLVLNHGEE